MTPVAVRDLVSFVFRHGDLYPSGEGRSVEAWEGTLAHSAIQKQRGRNDARYRKEVSLKLPIALLGERRQLQGRIDGLTGLPARCPFAEHVELAASACLTRRFWQRRAGSKPL